MKFFQYFYEIRGRHGRMVIGATGRWFSLGTSVSSTNKTDGHDITEILLKVALKLHDYYETKVCL